MWSSRVPYTDFMYLEESKLVVLILVPLCDRDAVVPCKNRALDHRVKPSLSHWCHQILLLLKHTCFPQRTFTVSLAILSFVFPQSCQ